MKSPANSVSKTSEHGAVLVAVLWLVTLMTLLVVSLGGNVRSNVDLSRLEIDRLQTETTLDSAVEIAAARLLADGNEAWDGHAEFVNLNGASVEIRVLDASSLVDIARAQPDLIRALADKVLGGGGASNALADAILDRRSTDEQKPSSELPFQSVDEIYELAGERPELVDKLIPFIGLYSKGGRVNVRASSRAVIESVPGISITDVDDILSLQRSRDANIAAYQAIAARYGQYLTAEAGNVYIVEAKVMGGLHMLAGSSLRATIALNRKNGNAPFQIVRLSW